MTPFGNIRSALSKQVPSRIVRLLRGLGRIADDLGCEAFAVGGCVRDLLIRSGTIDIDVTVEGDGHKVARAAAKLFGAEALFHERFHTAVLTFPDGFILDVATARREYYPEPASLPVVQPSSIEDDLIRRDFTINALAFRLNPSRFGDLMDVSSGLEDLKDGIIRVFHFRSMHDDPTRAFRAARFSGRYGFMIESKTRMLMRNIVKEGLIRLLSGERVLRELRLILEEEMPELSLQILQGYGILKVIHPELRFRSHDGQDFQKLRKLLKSGSLAAEKEKIEAWGMGFVLLTRNLDSTSRRVLASRLSLPALCSEWLEEGGTLFQKTIPAIEKSNLPIEIIELLRAYRCLEPLIAGAAVGRGNAKKPLLMYLKRWRHIRPMLNGNDLKKMGLRPGPVFQEIFKGIVKARLEGRVKTKKDERRHVIAMIDAGDIV